ncbi:MAG: hypothetical protein ACEPOV_08985 [Hyphomicrobiales bacterium]
MNRLLYLFTFFTFSLLLAVGCSKKEIEVTDDRSSVEEEVEVTPPAEENLEVVPNPFDGEPNFFIGFYNVENLFDIYNDPEKNDDDFTPSGKLKWDTERYNNKLNNISRAIKAIGNNGPSIIGLAEIENKKVLEDLIKTENLSSLDFGIIHKEGPDRRGIDNALLYRKESFELLETDFTTILFPFSSNSRTRDILYAKGLVGKDTLHVFVNHWYARFSGGSSDRYRIWCARILESLINPIVKKNPKSNIVIMGDFNDNPDNASMLYYLKANEIPDKVKINKLYNLSFDAYNKGNGTLYYDGWNYFDQMIVSGNILGNQENDFKITSLDATILNDDFLMYTSSTGKKPSRTYSGSRYYGGYSDHLPVFIGLSVE